MNRIRALVVDDEPLGRERIVGLLRSEADIELVGEVEDGVEAVAAIDRLQPDLVFLDVQMPELDGFGVLEALGSERRPMVVFVTAYDRYALQAFEVHALDYLLKPFDDARFRRALDRVRQQLQSGESGGFAHRIGDLIDALKVDTSRPARLMVRSNGRIFFVKPAEIEWIEAAGNYACLHVGTTTHILRETMSGLERRLDAEKFVRIHRSTIVNVDRIRELQADFGGEYIVVLNDGTRLTLSRGYREKLEARLGKFHGRA